MAVIWASGNGRRRTGSTSMLALRTSGWKLDQCLQARGRTSWRLSIWYPSTTLLTNLWSQKAGSRPSQDSERYGPGIFVDLFIVYHHSSTVYFRESLLERTRALQKKQRSGHIAPPTTPYTPASVGSNSNVLGGKERVPRMEVPDFTPLGRRAAPPRKSQPTVPQPVTHDTTSNDPTPDQGPLIPPTLLAPRYSHLLEEAIAISQQGSTLPETQDSILHYQYKVDDKSHSSDVPSTTIGKRVKGFLFSYLPTLPKSSSTARKGPVSLQPSLPIPPIEILSKERGPVVTPARAPLLKPKHPKELVVLHPAPQPPTVSYIPRLKKPQRLVELRPPAPPLITEPTPIPRPRRSSGSSVKDLVRGFEEIQALSCDKPKLNHGWKKYADKRPRWKP